MKAVWTWIKAHWRQILLILVAAGGAVAVYETVQEVVVGKVQHPQSFVPDGSNAVLAKGPDGKFHYMPLPAGVTSNRVTAAEVTPGGKGVVQVDNAPIDQV